MKPNAPSFESLPAKEKQKLTTYGAGTPPFAGYEFDFDARIPRWVPGEGVDDAYAGLDFSTQPCSIPQLQATMPKATPGGFVYLTQPSDMPIVAAYSTRERAERDVEMIFKACGNRLTIIELPLEA